MIDHSNITDQLVRYMADNINSGKWKVGEKIPSENQLVQELGVSRASVRTAIQYLAGLGVVETQHGKGSFLLEDRVDPQEQQKERITAEDCRNIGNVLVFRLAVESETAYLAAANASKEHIQGLEHTLDRMKKYRGNREKFVHQDIEFHRLISQASGNPLLEKSLARVFAETKRNHQQMNELFGYDDGINYHTKILESVRNRDAEEARQQMREHLLHAIQKLNQ